MINGTNGSNGHSNGINGMAVAFQTLPKEAKLMQEVTPETRLVKDLRTHYDNDFIVSPAYKASLPDMQNTSDNRGSAVPIQHVGIHNFKIPMRVVTRDGGVQQVHCSVTGTVSRTRTKKASI